jgi:hypothetical protein
LPKARGKRLPRPSRHVALGVEIAVKRAPGRRVVEQLDGANLDDAMSAQRVEASCLGV